MGGGERRSKHGSIESSRVVSPDWIADLSGGEVECFVSASISSDRSLKGASWRMYDTRT